MNQNLSILYEPFRLKNLELKNRLVMAPMHTKFSSETGEVTDRLSAYLEARARGGIGLIVLENTCIDWVYGRPAGNPVTIHDDMCRSGLSNIPLAVHRHGARIVTQLQHTGRQNVRSNIPGGMQPLAPSAVKSNRGGDEPRPLEEHEIERIIQQFVDGARRSKESGFDGVELHGAHGYLLTQFFSPYTNRRTDKWGGNLSNRARFPLEIVRRIRAEVGANFPILYRLSAEERIPGGTTLEDSLQLVRMLDEAGVDSVEGCHADGLDIETWAREGLVDVLILGTRTIKVDVDSFRKAMAGAQVKLMPSFDCYHATDGYHGDQSLDLVCGVFGNYLHQGADGVGAFNGIIGSPEQAKKLGLTQTDTRDLQVFSTIGSLTTMSDKARYYPIDRRGGYAHNEGHGSSNNDAPLPIALRNDQAPSTLTLPIWEPVKSGATARLRLVLFQHIESDEVAVQLNGNALKQDVVDAQWKDPRIFSPDLQPATVTPGALVRNLAAQKLTLLEFLVPTEILKRGDNSIAISVDRKGPFPPSKSVKVEKVELHLK